jgi:hypothetical protein
VEGKRVMRSGLDRPQPKLESSFNRSPFGPLFFIPDSITRTHSHPILFASTHSPRLSFPLPACLPTEVEGRENHFFFIIINVGICLTLRLFLLILVVLKLIII